MNSSDNYRIAESFAKASSFIFWVIFALTACLIIFPSLENILSPFLIVGSIAGIGSGFMLSLYQTRGNRFLRSSQLADALGAPVGDAQRADYYNSPVPYSMKRLATTTLENTLFTMRVLTKMLHRERVFVMVYLALFVLLLCFRWTTLGCLLFLAQTIFSADLLMNWIRMEQYLIRVEKTHDGLRQFFVQGAREDLAGDAIVLAAFTNYECSKDESGVMLDGAVFEALNPSVTIEWETLKKTLKIS